MHLNTPRFSGTMSSSLAWSNIYQYGFFPAKQATAKALEQFGERVKNELPKNVGLVIWTDRVAGNWEADVSRFAVDCYTQDAAGQTYIQTHDLSKSHTGLGGHPIAMRNFKKALNTALEKGKAFAQQVQAQGTEGLTKTLWPNKEYMREYTYPSLN